jgi:hypothetical protein
MGIRQGLCLTVVLVVSRQALQSQDQALSLSMVEVHQLWPIDGVFGVRRERACRTIHFYQHLGN